MQSPLKCSPKFFGLKKKGSRRLGIQTTLLNSIWNLFNRVVAMRENKRYLHVVVEGGRFAEIEAKKLFSQAVLETLGELGAAKAAFAFKGFDVEKQEAVGKCTTKSMEEVIAALALKRFFEGKDVALRLQKIAGSYSPRKK